MERVADGKEEAIMNLIGSDVVDDAGEAGVASNHHRCIVDRL